MNLLLVDDDAYVTEAIQANVDWKNLRVEEIFVAHSVSQAKRIITERSIQLVICDIEMPKAKGFELIQWIRDEKFLITYIFLTSYAEFEYANQAIKLNSFAYALKPIEYEELTKLISQAIDQEEGLLKTAVYERVYDSWNEMETERKKQFWRTFLIDEQPELPSDIQKNIEKFRLSYTGQEQFILLMAEYYDDEDVSGRLGRSMFYFTVCNVFEEVFSIKGIEIEAIFAGENEIQIVVFKCQEESAQAGLNECGNRFIPIIEKYFHMKCSIFLSGLNRLHRMKKAFHELQLMQMQDVTRGGKVRRADDFSVQAVVYCPPKWKVWEGIMEDMNPRSLITEVDTYLDMLARGRNVNREVLNRFVIEFLQIYGAVLKKKELLSHMMEYADYRPETMNRAGNSLEGCKAYLKDMIEKTMWLAGQTDSSLSVAKTVRRYIDEHLQEELSRESLAEMVYLNADYLARVFKKEVGDSIGNYIMNQRMNIAKELLEKTDQPINAIAIRVGYDNFSYFSKVFKTETSYTPKEYRKMHYKGKEL